MSSSGDGNPLWYLVIVAVLGLCLILGTCKKEPTAEERDRASQKRREREARERLDRETDEMLKAIEDARVREEMERQRRRRGF